MQRGDGHEGMATLSGELQALSKEYATPLVIAAQLNRNAVGRDGGGTDTLAESDAIGRDADAVIINKKMSESVVMHRLAKFRHGRDGYKWYSQFQPGKGIFKEVSYQEAMDLKDQDDDKKDKEN
jgi:hypothetical protein